MNTFPILPGVDINLTLLVFLSLAAGTISGFVGVGGGFIMTPALIIMGFPARMAVGTGILWVMGNSIIGTLRHRYLGNVDFKLGLLIVLFMFGGMEVGIRSLNAATRSGMAETAVLSVTICVLLTVGSSIFLESFRSKSRLGKGKEGQATKNNDKSDKSLVRFVSGIRIPPVLRFPKSGTSISLWVIVLIGFGSGVLAGFIGVGGGFVLVPSMVYLFGVPSFIAVGTSLFQIIFPSAFGAARYTMEGSVVVFASFIMIAGSAIGIYFGAQLTRYLHEISMKYILASTIMVAVCGSVLKMVKVISGTESAIVQNAMCIVTFGGLAAIFLILIVLFIAAIRKSKNQAVPSWIQPFLKDE